MTQTQGASAPLGRSDVAVVGGGIVGVACALELARRGVSVTLIERDRLGHGCSYGNAGWLTPSLAVPLPAPGLIWKSLGWLFDPESPLYIQPRLDPLLARWLAGFLLATRRSRFARGAEALVELSRTSVDFWERLARARPTFGFARHGLVSIYESRRAFDAARWTAELVARHGARFEVWSAEQVREREPAVVGPQIGAYFFPGDAHCEPYPAMLALAAEALAAGVTIHEETELYALAPGENGADQRLTTTRGELRAEHVVLAAGSWSHRLGRTLGLRIPILGAKGYSLVLPRLERHPSRSLNLAERKVAVNPHAGGLRVAGTLELVRDDLSINRRRVAAIERAVRGMLDIPETAVARELWRGLRPCTPDGMPLIGRARGRGNLWLATGHQMMGLKTAPSTGVLLAELLTGAPPSFDPAPFRADRY